MQRQPLNVGKAILIGHLMVNLPVMVIILCAAGVGALLASLAALIEPALARWFWAIVSIAVIAGSGCAWLWRSFAVPRWRKERLDPRHEVIPVRRRADPLERTRLVVHRNHAAPRPRRHRDEPAAANAVSARQRREVSPSQHTGRQRREGLLQRR